MQRARSVTLLYITVPYTPTPLYPRGDTPRALDSTICVCVLLYTFYTRLE